MPKALRAIFQFLLGGLIVWIASIYVLPWVDWFGAYLMLTARYEI